MVFLPEWEASRHFRRAISLGGFDEDATRNSENRRRFLAVLAVGKACNRVAGPWRYRKTSRGRRDIRNSEEYADALVSNLDNVLVGVKTADCVPVLIADR